MIEVISPHFSGYEASLFPLPLISSSWLLSLAVRLPQQLSPALLLPPPVPPDSPVSSRPVVSAPISSRSVVPAHMSDLVSSATSSSGSATLPATLPPLFLFLLGLHLCLMSPSSHTPFPARIIMTGGGILKCCWLCGTMTLTNPSPASFLRLVEKGATSYCSYSALEL